MARNSDNDSIPPGWRPTGLQPTGTVEEDLSTIQQLKEYSKDGRFLIITTVQRIDLYAAKRFTQKKQYEQQALYVYDILARYMDNSTTIDFCRQLVLLFLQGTIEIFTDSMGATFINLPTGKGQAELIRLIVSHMTAQKQQAIHDSNHFNALKYLLIEHLRQRCHPITVNSMSSTLRRVVNEY